MKINIMTLFPDMYTGFLSESIIGRAIKQSLLEVDLYNIRDESKLKSKSVDDYTYGGGNGMLMMAEPIVDTHKKIADGKKIRTIYLSPKGKIFNQKLAKELSKENELILLCGHYEGVDERALEIIEAEEISIGDYILTGGELASMVLVDTIARLIPGVLTNEESTSTESFENDLLEYPQYTRPAVYMGKEVPDVLISGDHKKVEEWRLKKSIEITKKNRPDLYEKYIKK